MWLDIALFPLFVAGLYAIGLGVLHAGRAKSPGYSSFFYPLTGLLTIGTLALAVNFVSGVAAFPNLPLLLLLAAAGIPHLRRADWRMGLGLALVLSPLAATMPPGLDAGLYHLPHQQWIRDEKIVFGLANFHGRFGFSSFLEYIAAPLWVAEQFKLVAYAVAAFMLVLLLYLYEWVRAPHRHVAAIGVLAVISLMLFEHEFKFGYTSTDTPTATLFIITFLYGLRLLLEQRPPARAQWAEFFTCALLCVMLKVSNAFILLWLAFVVISLAAARRMEWGAALRAATIPAIIGLAWLARGIIISGCLLYPVTFTCLPVEWAATVNAAEDARAITVHARHPGQPDITGHWFSERWLPRNQMFLLRCLAQALLVIGIYRWWSRKTSTHSRPITLPALAFMLASLAIWFMYSPTTRFGLGIFVLLPPLIAIALLGLRELSLPRRITGSALLCLLALETAALETRWESASLAFDPLSVPAPQGIRPHADYGTIISPSGECGLAKYCGFETRPPRHEKNGYTFLLPNANM